jgi:hypothetical protein
LVAGQSNGENFTLSYQDGTTRHAQALCDSVRTYVGVDFLYPINIASAGKGLDTFYNDLDWNVRFPSSTYTYGELYTNSMFTLLTDTVSSSSFPYFGQYISQRKHPKIVAILWIQGERDASKDMAAAGRYGDNLRYLIAKWRRDFRSPTLPVFVVKLSPIINRPVNTTTEIRSQMQSVADQDPYTHIINIDDFTGSDFNEPLGTYIHYSNAGCVKIKDRIKTIIRTIAFP